MVLSFEKFALNDVVSSVDAIIQPMAKAKGQDFHLEVTGIRHEYLVGDETRINQILINLLSNAVKYSDGDLSVTLSYSGEIVFSNAASELGGVEAERLFDRFFTVRSAGSSTGLGLSIAKTLVRQMNGTIFARYEKERLFITHSF